MKQIFLLALVLGLFVFSVPAQKEKTTGEVSDKQWEDLFKALDSENWNTAFKLSDEYIKLLKNDDKADSIGHLRYMFLYSAAGRVTRGDMSFDELAEKIKGFEGKEIIFPIRTVLAECSGKFNYVCPSEGEKNKAMVSASNRTGTSIHAFEYLEFKENIDFKKYEGKEIALGGVVKSIVLNPNKSKFLVMRIFISDAYIIEPEKPEPKKSENKRVG
jgi:hypothetical protein